MSEHSQHFGVKEWSIHRLNIWSVALSFEVILGHLFVRVWEQSGQDSFVEPTDAELENCCHSDVGPCLYIGPDHEDTQEPEHACSNDT